LGSLVSRVKALPEGRSPIRNVGINRFTDPDEGIIPQIEVLGAFELGNSHKTEAKQPVITFTFPTSYSCLGASITFEWAQKSSEISSNI